MSKDKSSKHQGNGLLCYNFLGFVTFSPGRSRDSPEIHKVTNFTCLGTYKTYKGPPQDYASNAG